MAFSVADGERDGPERRRNAVEDMEDSQMAQKASLQQVSELVSMFSRGVYDAEFAQALIEKRVGIIEKLNRITVPNLTAAQLCEQAQTQLGLTCLNPDLATWNFVTDEAGKTYEAMSWKPSHSVTTDEVRKHFPEGFKGNTAAFVAMLTEKDPMGWHASIPEDDRLFPYGGSLCAPYFNRDGDPRGLDLNGIYDKWDGGWSFWAFREVK